MLSPLPPLHIQCETCEPTITTWASTLYWGAGRGGGTAHITSSFQRYRLNLQTKRVTAPGTFVQYMIVKNQLGSLFKRKRFTPVTFQDEITYSNRNIKNKSTRSWLATAFCFINWQFYHVRCQAIEISILHVNNNGFAGPLIIGTFEKRTLISKHYTRLTRWNTLTLYSLSRTYIP